MRNVLLKILKWSRKLTASDVTLTMLERITGTRIYKRIPVGLDIYLDLKYRLENYNPDVIIDVGANTGQKTLKMRKEFPHAKLYCIEPVSETFEVLKHNLRGTNAMCFQMALGSKTEVSKIRKDLDPSNSVYSTLNKNVSIQFSNLTSEEVKVVTLSCFCKQQEISHVGYLKVDTEGYDFEVLKGAKTLIENANVEVIEVEVGMNPTNEFHASFNDVNTFLVNHNYLIFGIYEQIHDFIIGKPVLRRSNIVYISNKCLRNRDKVL